MVKVMSQHPHDGYPAPQPDPAAPFPAPPVAPPVSDPLADENPAAPEADDAGLTIFENPAPTYDAPSIPPPAPISFDEPVLAPVLPAPAPTAPPVTDADLAAPTYDGPALPPPTSLDAYSVPVAPAPVIAPPVAPPMGEPAAAPVLDLPPAPPAAPVLDLPPAPPAAPVLPPPPPAPEVVVPHVAEAAVAPAAPAYTDVPVLTFDEPAGYETEASLPAAAPSPVAVLDRPALVPDLTPDTQTGGSGGDGPDAIGYTVHEPRPRPAIERLLAGLVNSGGSDLHLAHGQPPRFRGSGALLPVPGEEVLVSSQIEDMCREFLHARAWEEFERNNDLDSSYSMSKEDGAAVTSRFRVNVFRSMGSTGVVARVIPTKIVTMDQLGLPNQLKRLATLPRGLVLFCGPTGSGKSTSMAALVDLINETREERIFTLEDPIEFVHSSKRCLISHREIGEDTPSFEEGLRRVRRQDPDVILVGEMRDYETIASAIEAADTGHLVIATLHTNSAPETISRIINQFPAAQQEQVRVTLASTLQAVVCQTLVPAPKTERGRVLAAEIMFINGAIRNNIRENDIPAIVGALVDRSNGNQSLDAHLADLYRAGLITKKEAIKKASSPAALEQMLGGPNTGTR
jgi:twitching motility protein PilT